MSSGSIPVLKVQKRSLAETWEESLIMVHGWGVPVKTEYDNPEDPPSLDCTMLMVCEEPSSEPLIHRAFPGGLADLEEYRQEVLYGIKDHWVRNPSDPDDTRWDYTYHQRLTVYDSAPLRWPVDQLAEVVKKLAKTPYSRRVQAVTWQPWVDNDISDPPCLQSLWFRILPDDDDVWTLNMNVRFRSRDAYDAAYMNCFAFVALMEQTAQRVAELAGREVKLGRYCDLSDSYHIYGKRRAAFEEGFLKQVETRSFEDRTWTREFAAPFFEEARIEIVEKIRRKDTEDAKGDNS